MESWQLLGSEVMDHTCCCASSVHLLHSSDLLLDFQTCKDSSQHFSRPILSLKLMRIDDPENNKELFKSSIPLRIKKEQHVVKKSKGHALGLIFGQADRMTAAYEERMGEAMRRKISGNNLLFFPLKGNVCWMFHHDNNMKHTWHLRSGSIFQGPGVVQLVSRPEHKRKSGAGKSVSLSNSPKT